MKGVDFILIILVKLMDLFYVTIHKNQIIHNLNLIRFMLKIQ